LDQTALAAKVGLSKSSISRIMSGAQEPKLRLAYDLARALGVTLDYLVEDAAEPETASQLVMATEDEVTVLKIVRRLGVDVAIDRLLGIDQTGGGHAGGGRVRDDVSRDHHADEDHAGGANENHAGAP
jgi:transcriptional regulator with XRE-family HTH domain